MRPRKNTTGALDAMPLATHERGGKHDSNARPTDLLLLTTSVVILQQVFSPSKTQRRCACVSRNKKGQEGSLGIEKG